MNKLLSPRIVFLSSFKSTIVAPFLHLTVGSGVPDTSQGSDIDCPSNTVNALTVVEIVG